MLSVLVVLVQTALPWPCCAAVLAILFLITLLGLIYKFKKKKKKTLGLQLAGLCGFQVLGFCFASDCWTFPCYV